MNAFVVQADGKKKSVVLFPDDIGGGRIKKQVIPAKDGKKGTIRITRQFRDGGNR